MSVRQSLYGQSLVRSANTVNFGSEPQDKRWKRDWYTPAKTAPTAPPSTSATPTPFHDERDTPEASQKLNFSIRTWMVDTDYKEVADGDDSDYIDLNKYNTNKQTRDTTNGMSDDAIRGAVGSESALPSLSKSTDDAASDAAQTATPTADPTPAPETPGSETPTTETPTLQTPAVNVPSTDTPAADTPMTDASAEVTPSNETPIESVSATPAPTEPAVATPDVAAEPESAP
ncbi:Serum response factor-binding protein 1 [Cyberlindnera fabianii]|uniref:Serum response factor-binding protein 1 n=1 Tax=Cyberlindnera fabianii TaxID=36022 RepID=A0A1V2L0A6_CYBFA|nr:Serum response factor-binding protein 1 [Cyberlindnera fabianii]